VPVFMGTTIMVRIKVQVEYQVVVVQYGARDREVVGSWHTWATARDLEHGANLVCAPEGELSIPCFRGR